MKATAFLPAAAAALLAFSMSVASGQDACITEFTACMNTCGLKPSKPVQDSCFSRCETKNGICSERVFGKRPSGGTGAAPAAAKSNDATMQRQAPPPREGQAAPEAAPAKQPVAPEPKRAPPLVPR